MEKSHTEGGPQDTSLSGVVWLHRPRTVMRAPQPKDQNLGSTGPLFINDLTFVSADGLFGHMEIPFVTYVS